MAFVEETSLTASDAAVSDNFGTAAALSAGGTILAIGAQSWESAGTDRGVAYIFDWSGAAWVERAAVVTPSTAADLDYFGVAAALSDDGAILAVGAYSGPNDRGSVFIFDWGGASWTERSIVTPSDAADNDRFGSGAALSSDGTILAVGAYTWESAGTDRGCVYIFDWNGSAWVERAAVVTPADAADGDRFGGATALSDDGTILAVGAHLWESAGTDRGTVYIFDWNGSAWVERGNIIPADAADSDNFGSSVALNSDGTVLAAGAQGWESAGTDRGCVYIFDWNGSAWVEREIVNPADAGDGDKFGVACAFSSTTEQLAVGAHNWDGAFSNQGTVYLFSTDAAPYARSVTIENEVFDDGTQAVTIENEIILGTVIDIVVSAIESVIYQLGSYSVDITQTQISSAEPVGLGIRQTLYASGTLSVGIQNVVTETVYTVSAGIEQDVFGPLTISFGIANQVYATSPGTTTTPAGTVIPAGLVSLNYVNPAPGTPTNQTDYWTSKVILKGLDVSVNLTGTLSIDNEESAASVATFTLKPTAGLVDLTNWVRAEVLVYYIKTDASGNHLVEFQLFNGFVDVPTYDPQSRLTTFTCTDELQKAFETKSIEQINAVVGGFWSADIFDEEVDKWSYAQDRLSTIPYSLDYDVNRVLVKTPWAAKITPDFTMNEAVVFDNSLSVELGNSRNIVNQVDISFAYQYDTFKEVTQKYQWEMLPSVGVASGVFGIAPVTYPMVVEAVVSDGWVFAEEPYFKAWPESGWYDGTFVQNTDRTMIVSTYFRATKRYNQYVNELATFSLQATKSIESLGKLDLKEEYSLTVEYAEDADAFDATEELTGSYEAKLNAFYSGANQENVEVNPSFVGVVDVPYDYTVYANDYASIIEEGVEVFDLSSSIIKNDRTELEANVEVVQNLHKTNILGSHRGNSVQFSCLIEPTVTRASTVRVDTTNVIAQGKVRQVTHTLDIEAGSALSTVVVGVSRSTAVGITDTETPLDSTVAPPDIPNEESVSPVNSTLLNWVEADQGGAAKTNTGMEAYYGETRFLVPFPDVNQDNIDEISVETVKEFIIDVPNEELTLNA